MRDGNDFHKCLTELEEPLRRFARRFVSDDNDVNDLVQETFLKALKYSHQFNPGTSLKSWLFTIMRNTFCTAYRKRIREPVIAESLPHLAMTSEAPQLAHVRYGELRRALETLPEKTRTALILTASGTSYEEAAVICGCKTGTVKSRINRARHDLAVAIGDKDAASSRN